MATLTKEQQNVVVHPCGKHARVLAVAGSGKTTTMVHRIHYLVRQQHVNPARIRVLMFNRLARVQFRDKLRKVGLPEGLQPQVHTFHSFSYQFISEMIASGRLPGTLVFWVDDKAELTRTYVHRAIDNLVARGCMPPDSVDPDDALEAIGLWKGSLIPPHPSRAGYRGNPYVPLVYQEFETLRVQAYGLTFDDFVPIAVSALESEADLRRNWSNASDHIIVDEYQDVNYGQQRLIELLAGNRADVMVVGDDDQTIYEWRGARPNYILRQFRTVFNNKPHADYTLSRSFRFGPVIAQCAQNVISFSANRVCKPLIAHAAAKPAFIEILLDSSEQGTDVNKELAQQAVSCVQECKDPRRVIVLARMFSQLSGLEAEFLARHIPYRVVGRAPFFERRELRVLLDYVRLAAMIDQPVTQKADSLLHSVANTPNRRLSKDILRQGMMAAAKTGGSTRAALEALASSWDSHLSARQRSQADDLLARLERLHERLSREPNLKAGDLLSWLVDALNYLRHFDDYYGQGENSEDRKRAVRLFCGYAQSTGLRALDFVQHVEKLDPTRGRPEKELIVMTTVFRTKGLEYDYVLIPNCEEGYMPCLVGTGNLVFDKAGIVAEPEPSDVIENERRLFYVAITRAKKGVYIGGAVPPQKGSQATSSPNRVSRFVYEMQREPTVALMTALQKLAAGEKTARDELRRAVAQHGGLSAAIQNLITAYLPDIREHDLGRDVQRLAASLPAQTFRYPAAYNHTQPSVPSGDKPPWSDDEPPWWEAEQHW
ncbi:MAG: ATP-dependent helicase [Anaerolineae bacterium]|nr:ATP-dependent helicase [Anaerolineae bacterium]